MNLCQCSIDGSVLRRFIRRLQLRGSLLFAYIADFFLRLQRRIQLLAELGRQLILLTLLPDDFSDLRVVNQCSVRLLVVLEEVLDPLQLHNGQVSAHFELVLELLLVSE